VRECLRLFQWRKETATARGALVKRKFPMSQNRATAFYLRFIPRMQRIQAEFTWKQQGDAMRVLGATAVAVVTLFIVDQFLNAGRYSEVVADALIQVGSIVGVRV
jgi:hypothetical protein